MFHATAVIFCQVAAIMSQEAITRILAVEQRATRMHGDALQHATELITVAEKAALALRKQGVIQAQQQAQQVLEAGRERAEIERARIIAQAGADAQLLDTLATKNFSRAVDFVLEQIIGHE